MRRLSYVCAAALLACGPSGGGAGGDGGTPGADAGDDEGPSGGGDRADAAPAASCDKMDILFVIDDSGSMGEEQANLAANFPGFIDVLDGFTTSAGDPIDYRVAVTTTGVTKDFYVDDPFWGASPVSQEGHDGRLLAGNGCGLAADEPWLSRGAANLTDAFSCVASVGAEGPGLEMPLEAARLAIGPRVADGSNDGFLRDDALLAVIVLTDENDCSYTGEGFTVPVQGFEAVCDDADAEPVETYLSAFDEAAGERGRWATAIIAGVGPGPCNSELGAATEATRLLDFAEQVGDNAVTSSICEGDLAKGLEDALATFEAACNSFPDID